MIHSTTIKKVLTLSVLVFEILISTTVYAQTISRIDDNGNLLVNEQNFLPFGFYCEALAFEDYPNLAQQIAAGGFNYIYAESYIKPPNQIEAYLSNYSDFLMDCEALNVKVVSGLLWYGATPELFSTYVNALKVHPALICWNLMDDANDKEIEWVAQQKEQVMALDSSRVTSISFYSNEPNAPYMLPLTELACMQSYPWGLDDGRFDLSHTEYLFRNLVLACRDENVVPIATPQTFNWELETYPSPQHVDCQSYLAFATGMKGILYYTFKDYDNNSTIDVAQPEVFMAAGNVANEILHSEWQSVILHGEHTYANLGQYRYYATWRYNNAFYLVAVNASHDNSYYYEIPLPDGVSNDAVNFFDYRPDSLSVQNDSLQGQLEPYQVAIYKMDLTTSVTASYKQPEIKVVPNPVSNTFYLSGVQSPCKICIFNLQGSVVQRTKTYNPQETIDISSLSPGIYVVKVVANTHETVQTLKLIKL